MLLGCSHTNFNSIGHKDALYYFEDYVTSVTILLLASFHPLRTHTYVIDILVFSLDKEVVLGARLCGRFRYL